MTGMIRLTKIEITLIVKLSRSNPQRFRNSRIQTLILGISQDSDFKILENNLPQNAHAAGFDFLAKSELILAIKAKKKYCHEIVLIPILKPSRRLYIVQFQISIADDFRIIYGRLEIHTTSSKILECQKYI